MEYGGSDIMKHFMQNITTRTYYPTLHSAVQTVPLDRTHRKALKSEFIGNRPVVRLRFRWKGIVQQTDRCDRWKLTAQIGTVWRQNVR